MSNVETAKKWVAGREAGDADACAALCDDDVVLKRPTDIMCPTQGLDACKGVWSSAVPEPDSVLVDWYEKDGIVSRDITVTALGGLFSGKARSSLKFNADGKIVEIDITTL